MVKRSRNNNRRRTSYGTGRVRSIQLPSPYNRLSQDSVCIHGRGVNTTTYNGGTGYTTGYILLTPIFITGVSTLQSLVASMAGLAGTYTRFTVANISVKVLPTIPTTTGAIFAVGYEPDQASSGSFNPTSIADVLVSKHHVSTNQTSIKSFSLSPMSYRGDWCAVDSGSGPLASNCGYLQVFSNYTADSTVGAVIGFLDISFDLVFAGLRS